MKDKSRVHIFVSGRVQGVSFRYYTAQKAEELGLKGWVRNTEDGELEAVFEGKQDKIKEIISWMRKGPPSAKIDNINIKEEQNRGEFSNFEIRF